MQHTLFDYSGKTDVTSDITCISSDIQEKKGNGIIFPCPAARQFPIGETRCNHIKHCPDCQRLIKELDKIAYGGKKYGIDTLFSFGLENINGNRISKQII